MLTPSAPWRKFSKLTVSEQDGGVTTGPTVTQVIAGNGPVLMVSLSCGLQVNTGARCSAPPPRSVAP